MPAGSAQDGYAAAFPKGSPLVERFNAALAEMKADGSLKDITDRWFVGLKDTKRSGGLNLNFGILKDYVPYMLRGISVTLLFTLVSTLLGFILGTILSLFKLSSVRPLRWFATA